MSSIVEAIYELQYNPFKYGGYIASFYDLVGESDNNLLLSQLVIPLCSHPVFGQTLLNSNIKSTIWTVFKDRSKLYDLQERIDEFQGLTDQCIQYCIVNDWICVDEKKLILRYCGESTSFTIQRNAQKLGRLLSNHSVLEIYSFLGVKPR